MSQENKDILPIVVSIEPKLARDIDLGLSRAIHRVMRNIVIGACIFLFLSWINGSFDKDDTDGIDRSGMRLHTDASTGCEYLSTPNGGVTPRLNKDGSHRGCRR